MPHSGQYIPERKWKNEAENSYSRLHRRRFYIRRVALCRGAQARTPRARA